jgi:zinc/manganese transport system substrate-binding protein
MKPFLVLVLGLAAALSNTLAHAALNVFACEPEWAALAKELGGDKVSVFQAITAQQDAHRVEARPSLMARARSADLLVCTGAELEISWLPLLLRSAGNRKIQVGQPGNFMAADLVVKIEVPARLDRAEGDVHPYGNPHIHLDPRNISRIARALAERLAQVDPANAAHYHGRTGDFLARWETAIPQWQARGAVLKGMRVVSHHKDYNYLFGWLGMEGSLSLEPKPGLQPSVAYLGELLGRLQTEPAEAITRSVYSDPKPSGWLSARAKLPVVVLPYTVGGTQEAKDLFGLFEDSINRLVNTRKPG